MIHLFLIIGSQSTDNDLDMYSPYTLVSIVAFTALTACDGRDDDSRVQRELRNEVIQQRINAATPQLLDRSYQTILGPMSVQQRSEFLKALAAIMKSCRNSTKADTEFRKKIDGKTVSALIAEAQTLHED